MGWFLVALAFPPIDDAAGDPEAARIGRVVETFDGGGFTYAWLEGSEGNVWIAGPLTPLEAGQTVATTQGVEMAGFHSRALDRTFDSIWFVAGVRVMGVEAPPVAVPAPTPVVPGRTSVADLVAGRSTLAGAEVVVAGQVVRATDPILGRRWVHLQDGSGSAADASHDLTLTTAEVFAVGQWVVVRGRVGV
ncbi:MAG: hypothetical protein ABMA64_42440, partial [Myxococcota bacterium]